MDIKFNKNEDQNKLLVSELKKETGKSKIRRWTNPYRKAACAR